MKIGFVAIAYEDYIGDLSNTLTQRALESLKLAGAEVVDAGEPVVSMRQAVRASVSLLGQDVDGVVLFLSTWVDCSVVMTVVQEIGMLPILLWGAPMVTVGGMLQSTGSYVSYAMFKGVLDRIGRPYAGLLGAPGEGDCEGMVARFCRVASARKRLRRARLGMVGYTSMSIYTGTFDHVLLRALVGPEVVHIDSYTVIRRAEAMVAERAAAQERWLRDASPVAEDVRPLDLDTAARVAQALLDLSHELDLDGVNVKCQTEFSKEFGAVACVPVSALSDQGVVGSCEGDMLCTVSMLLLHALCGESVSYGDSMNHVGDVLTLSACGFLPYSFAERERRLIRKFMPHPGFSGIQNSFTARPGRMTAVRVVEDVGAYHAVVFTGEALPTKLRQGYMPAVDLKLDGDMHKLVKSYNGQHYAFAYGDWADDIEQYCALNGIGLVRI